MPGSLNRISVTTRTAPVTICCFSGVTPPRPSEFCTKASTRTATSTPASVPLPRNMLTPPSTTPVITGSSSPLPCRSGRSPDSSEHDCGDRAQRDQDTKDCALEVDTGEARCLAVVADRVECVPRRAGKSCLKALSNCNRYTLTCQAQFALTLPATT